MKKALLIDIDDTIYSEEDYVRSGYRAVAAYLSRKAEGMTQQEIYNRMLYEFRRSGRTFLFNRVLEYLGISNISIEKLVRLYREHTPDIAPYEGVAETLQYLSQRFALAFVTDGSLVMQQQKVHALSSCIKDIPVVYCDAHGASKPSLKPYEIAAEMLHVPLNHCIIVGDDPYCDIQAAAHANLRAIRVLTGRASEIAAFVVPEEYFEIPSFLSLLEVL